MGKPEFRERERFTYGDYVNWPDEERWEILAGVVYAITPAPTCRHQEILIELATQIRTLLRNQPYRAYCVPFDVRLPEKDETDAEIATVVQPDIAVVCDQSKLDEKGCRGAPDFIIEIISPGTASRDQAEKVALYEAHGVREYWILHPVDELVTVRVLDATGRYEIPRVLKLSGRVAVSVLPGIRLDMDLLNS